MGTIRNRLCRVSPRRVNVMYLHGDLGGDQGFQRNCWSWCVVDINRLVRAADRGAHDYQEF